MNVALFSPAWFPVPPAGYGGVENVVHLLADGLVDAGVDVTLFASGDSTTNATLVAAFDRAPSEHIGETFWELQHALALLERVDEFDLVHDHSGLLGLTLFGLTRQPVLHTVHGPLTGEPGLVYEKACDVAPDAGLVSLTLNQRRPLPTLNWVANVHNAIALTQFPCNRSPEDFLLFLGRMSPDKGAPNAIAVARASRRPLKIAAKCREPGEIAYFERFVEPHLDGQIEYVGEVGHEEKCDLLRRAHALLMPIEWEEPFGLVIIEAMACGTPVVAFRRGSVPELLRDGRTGFIVSTVDEMANAVARVGTIDPLTLRREAERRFTTERMISRYLAAYEDMIDRKRHDVATAA